MKIEANGIQINYELLGNLRNFFSKRVFKITGE